MSETVVSATIGRTAGSRPSRRLRAEGQLPGVVYGLGKESVPVAVSYVELREALKTEAGLNTIFQLDIDGTKETVLVRSIERHPIKRTVLHADFLRVDTSKKVKVKVPIQLIGDPSAVTSAGGMVEQNMFEIEVETSPLNIPNAIEADQSVMDLDTSISVADLKLPEGVVTLVDPGLSVVAPVVTRASKMDDEAAEAAGGEEGEDGASEGADASSDS